MMIDDSSIRRAGLMASLHYMGAALLYIAVFWILSPREVDTLEEGGGFPVMVPAMIVIVLLSVGAGAYLSSTSFFRKAQGPQVRWSIRRGIAITLLSGMAGGMLSLYFLMIVGWIRGTGSNVEIIPHLPMMIFGYIRYGMPVFFWALPFSIPASLLYRRVVRRLLVEQEANVARAAVEDIEDDDDLECVAS